MWIDSVCYVCGDVREHMMEEHHAVPRRYNGNDGDENVYQVCSNCHTALEKMYNDGFYDRLVAKFGLEAPARQHIDKSDVDLEDLDMAQPIDDDSAQILACKAVFDQAIIDGSGDGWVSLNAAVGRIRDYLPDDAPVQTPNELWGNLIEHISEDRLEQKQIGDVTHLRCGGSAKTRIFATGSGVTTGGSAHRQLLRDCYRPLTELGLIVDVLEQDGSQMPDAVGRVSDIDLFQIEEGDDAKDIAEKFSEFEEEYPLLSRLTDGRDIAIEAEHSTARTQKGKTVTNCNAAISRGMRCLLIAYEEEANLLWELLMEQPRGMRQHPDESYKYRLYNMGDLYIKSDRMMRPATSSRTEWIYDEAVGEYQLWDASGDVLSRFDTSSEVFSGIDEYPAKESECDGDDYVPIKKPAIPHPELTESFDPSDTMLDILVPDDGELYLYDDSELVPLDDVIDHRRDPNPLAGF